jgi:hypothetical protein
MRKEALFALAIFAFIVFAAGVIVWFANAPLQPQPQPTRLVMPDERIPH